MSIGMIPKGMYFLFLPALFAMRWREWKLLVSRTWPHTKTRYVSTLPPAARLRRCALGDPHSSSRARAPTTRIGAAWSHRPAATGVRSALGTWQRALQIGTRTSTTTRPPVNRGPRPSPGWPLALLTTSGELRASKPWAAATRGGASPPS